MLKHGIHRARNTAAAVVVTLAVGALLTAARASAQEETVPDHPMMSDRYFIGAGVMWADSNVTANLNSGTVGLGTLIDFEDDMGLDESNLIGLFLFRMHLSERWRLEAEYFSLNRDKDKQVSRAIDWGDLNIPVNAEVDSTFNLEDIRVSYSA